MTDHNSKKVIIVGATSGIGKALAELFYSRGYVVGITGRRLELLEQIQHKDPDRFFIKAFDITSEEAGQKLDDLIADMSDVDIIIVSSGVGFVNPHFHLKEEMNTVAVNIKGFTTIINHAFHYLEKRGGGHLAAITSIAALLPDPQAPAYSATKAYQSLYLKSLQIKIKKEKNKISITDIQPGFVDTDMAKGEGLFWVAPVDKAAKQIYAAILAKKQKVYITRRWKFIAWGLKLLRLTQS